MPLEADPQLHLLNLGQEPCSRIALLDYITLSWVWPSLGLVFLGLLPVTVWVCGLMFFEWWLNRSGS